MSYEARGMRVERDKPSNEYGHKFARHFVISRKIKLFGDPGKNVIFSKLSIGVLLYEQLY